MRPPRSLAETISEYELEVKFDNERLHARKALTALTSGTQNPAPNLVFCLANYLFDRRTKA
jgi:hypothetical protein